LWHRSPALDKSLLKKLGITHILNAAQGKKCMHVDTDAQIITSTVSEYLTHDVAHGIHNNGKNPDYPVPSSLEALKRVNAHKLLRR
ncbi:hypothetical protein BSL78_28613, partial [Apostichopus japonicus]